MKETISERMRRLWSEGKSISDAEAAEYVAWRIRRVFDEGVGPWEAILDADGLSPADVAVVVSVWRSIPRPDFDLETAALNELDGALEEIRDRQIADPNVGPGPFKLSFDPRRGFILAEDSAHERLDRLVKG